MLMYSREAFTDLFLLLSEVIQMLLKVGMPHLIIKLHYFARHPCHLSMALERQYEFLFQYKMLYILFDVIM